jgi:serine phosphatase RsbU (regulator of sigma subunit)/putative methionine-R-sulfoxide reductase with GAF domain
MANKFRDHQQDWKEFLSFGEELLKQPDTASLREYFSELVSSNFACQASLWLAEPFYPLPGEPPIETIQSAQPPEIILDLFGQYHKKKGSKQSRNLSNSVGEYAFPIATQGNLLGILYVAHDDGTFLTSIEIANLEGLASFAAVAMQVNRQVSLKNWRLDQISLVRSVSTQISNAQDLDDLCRRVTNLIQCSFDLYQVAIFTLDLEKKELTFRASSLECEADIPNPFLAVHYGKGLIGKCAKTGKEIVVKDVENDPDYIRHPALPFTKAEAVLPLIAENQILGVLDIQSSQKNTFHENDMLVLRSLADNIALAVEGTRLYDDLRLKADQMSAVAEVGYALSSTLDLEQLLQRITEVIHDRFSIPFVHIFTVHSGRRRVIYEAGSGLRAKGKKPNSFAYDLDATEGIIPSVARKGESYLASDVTRDPLYRPSRYYAKGIRSELTIPLKFGEEVLGILDLQTEESEAFSYEDIQVFESLASGIALAMRNATLYRTEKWRRNVAESFREIALMLSSNLALPDLLDQILIALERHLPCDASAIWLLDEISALPVEERPLRLAAVRGLAGKKIIDSAVESQKIRQFLNTGLTNDQVTIRRPEDPIGPLGTACGFSSKYSSIAVPLRSGEEIFGVLTLAHRAAGKYGGEASSIASTLANYAALAIQNARLFASAQEEAWSSTVLLQVTEATQSITSLDTLLSTMCRLTPLLVGIDQSAIFLLGADKETFELKSWYGFEPVEQEMAISDSDSIAFLKLHATLAPVFINDPAQELGMQTLTFTPGSSTMVILPLMSHGELQGAMLVSHDSKGEFGVQNRFSDQTLAILQGIAQQTSVGLENIRLVENRQEEAYITAVLLQVAQSVVSLNKLDEILDNIVQLMPILVGVDACVVYLWDEKNARFVPSNAVTPSKQEQDEVFQRFFQTGEFPLLDRVAESDKMATCPLESTAKTVIDWSSLDCFQEDEIDWESNPDWLLGFPLSIKGETFGVMLTRELNIQPAYQSKRLELIKGVVQQTALAIQNERLKEEMVGRERVEREFQLARQIQKTFLPQETPDIEGWDIAPRWRTAREVGGDFYDFFRTREGKIALAIADVSDKGMPAALYMTVTRTLIRSAVQSTNSPGEVLSRVNEMLAIDSPDSMFVTCIFALLDPSTGVLEYANAGHNLPLVIRNSSHTVEKLHKGGIALGVIEQAEYRDESINLEPGDTVLFYTDGVTEAFSSSGELFSENRLIDLVVESEYLCAKELLDNLESQIDLFRKGEPSSDDLTMIAVQRKNHDPV